MEFELVDADREHAESRLGQTVGGYKLESLLGVGGMAAVYAARGSDGQGVAVKVLHPHIARRADIRERFQREGQTAGRIDHPGVVRIRSGEEGAAAGVLVMELLDGSSLTDLIGNDGIDTDELLGYLDQTLDALVAAHEAGIIHRDLKPDNLFVTREGQIKILDFGIARVLDDLPGQQRTRTGMALGTVPFMAPEQALGKRKEIDGRTDLFALGAMAYRILSGRYIHDPSQGDSALLVAMATQPAAPLGSVAPHVAAPLCAIVDTAVAFSREARYPDARTMQADVQALRQGKAPPFAAARAASRQQATQVDRIAPDAAAIAAGVAGSTDSQAGRASRAPTVVSNTDPHKPTVVAVASSASTVATDSAASPPVQVPTLVSSGEGAKGAERGHPPKRSSGLLAAVAGAVVLIGVATALALGGGSEDDARGSSGRDEGSPAATANRSDPNLEGTRQGEPSREGRNHTVTARSLSARRKDVPSRDERVESSQYQRAATGWLDKASKGLDKKRDKEDRGKKERGKEDRRRGKKGKRKDD